ncbi:MAG: TrkH family potassium uptake protein [Oscillospiraceae bacterium]|nr:TrkH family potassium uptake protein [Oscillospiraceae bacterium]
MNYRTVINIIGKVLCVEAMFLLPALILSLILHEREAVTGILVTMAVAAALGFPLSRVRGRRPDIFARDGLVTVGLAWLAVSLVGALPFCVSGAIPSYIDALFETASGFTTTGATILREIESLPRGLLYWRSFTHWLGGMGVLVFLLALNPLSRKDSGENMHLLRAESPGVRASKLVPRMRDSASILYLIYIGLTGLEFLLLLLGRVPVFDSLTLAFGTAGTGGFTIRNDSAASYSPYAQWVLIVFMFLFSVNFNVYFLLLMRQVKKALRSSELHCFAGVFAFATLLFVLNTRSYFPDFWDGLRHSAFTTVSLMSTTGFVTTNFDLWPQISRSLIILLMFMGACAGSTGGGMKVVRVQLLFKSAYRSLYRAVHPNAVRLVHLDGERVDEPTVRSVDGFLLIYFLTVAAAGFLISADGFSFETNFSAALSCMSNVGPGLGGVGAVECYAGFSDFSKLVLTVTMLIGRLEIYPMLALALPGVWKGK